MKVLLIVLYTFAPHYPARGIQVLTAQEDSSNQAKTVVFKTQNLRWQHQIRGHHECPYVNHQSYCGTFRESTARSGSCVVSPSKTNIRLSRYDVGTHSTACKYK